MVDCIDIVSATDFHGARLGTRTPEYDSDLYDTYIEYLGCIGQADKYTQSVLEYITIYCQVL